MKKKSGEEWYSMGTAIVAPVCFLGAVAAAAKPGVELWWGWPCLAGLVVWFVVVPCFLRNRL